jgi:hypothetical protein
MVLIAYCVFILFSLRRESPNLILGRQTPHFEVVLLEGLKSTTSKSESRKVGSDGVRTDGTWRE